MAVYWISYQVPLILTQMVVYWKSHQILISQSQYFTILPLISTLQGQAEDLFIMVQKLQEQPLGTFWTGLGPEHRTQGKTIHLIPRQYLGTEIPPGATSATAEQHQPLLPL